MDTPGQRVQFGINYPLLSHPLPALMPNAHPMSPDVVSAVLSPSDTHCAFSVWMSDSRKLIEVG